MSIPTAGSRSSRGSVTWTARTWWRDARARAAACCQSEASRKSDTTTTWPRLDWCAERPATRRRGRPRCRAAVRRGACRTSAESAAMSQVPAGSGASGPRRRCPATSSPNRFRATVRNPKAAVARERRRRASRASGAEVQAGATGRRRPRSAARDRPRSCGPAGSATGRSGSSRSGGRRRRARTAGAGALAARADARSSVVAAQRCRRAGGVTSSSSRRSTAALVRPPATPRRQSRRAARSSVGLLQAAAPALHRASALLRLVLAGARPGAPDVVEDWPRRSSAPHALGERVVGEDQPVPEHLGRDVEDVLRTRNRRPRSTARARPAASRPSVARGLAPSATCAAISGTPQRDRVTRRHHEADRVVLHRVVHEHVVGRAPAARAAARVVSTCSACGGVTPMRRAISVSSSYDGCRTTICIRNRSRCASGQRVDALGLDRVLRGEHEERVGQRTGLAARWTRGARPSTSSSADCTFAGARLISSASTMFANIGPHSMSNVLARRPPDPRADDVGRDEVGRELRSARTSRRRPRPASRRSASWPGPGTPSMRQWPRARRQTSVRSTIRS